MSPRLLFAGTLALALLSGLALAQAPKPMPGSKLLAEFSRSVTSHTLRENEYDYGARGRHDVAVLSRAGAIPGSAAVITTVDPLHSRS